MNVKKIWFLMVLVLLGEVVVGQTLIVDAGKDIYCCIGETIQLGGKPLYIDNRDVCGVTTIKWDKKGDLKNDKLLTSANPKIVANTLGKTTYKVTVGGVIDEIDVYVLDNIKIKKIEFETDYDVFPDYEKSLSSGFPPISAYEKKWEDINLDETPEKNFPLGYIRNHKIKIKKLVCDFGTSLPSTIPVKIKATLGNLSIPLKDMTKLTATEYEVNNIETVTTLPDKIDLLDSLKIQWSFQINNGKSYCKKISKHRVYVTLDMPKKGTSNSIDNLETLLLIGCKAAKGSKAVINNVLESLNIFKKIYAVFQTKKIQRVQSSSSSAYLKYWGCVPSSISFSICQSIYGLLQYETSTCGTFSDFLIEINLKIGLKPDNFTIITVNPNTTYSPPLSDTCVGISTVGDRIFYVKNWNTLVNNNCLYESNDKSGVSGQGIEDPLGWFTNHTIVRYDTSATGFYLFDPSYGTNPFKSYKKWEEFSLFGYGFEVGLFTGISCLSSIAYRQKFEKYYLSGKVSATSPSMIYIASPY